MTIDSMTAGEMPLPDEQERLEALVRLRILDTPVESCFEEITRLTARLFGAPIAMLNMVDESRLWIKSCYGGPSLAVPRDISFSTRTIEQAGCLVSLNAREDERFATNPFVISDGGLRFYAGAPLTTREGLRVGALCVVDTKPWESFGSDQQELLMALASLAVDRMELRALEQEIEAQDGGCLQRRRSLAGKVQDAVRERLLKEVELEHAIQARQLVLYYQPEIDLESNSVIGFEALVRWKHPVRGLIPPGEFIPVAEESGLIIPLGEWGLAEACRQVLEWRAISDHKFDLRVSVNLSAKQFALPGLLETVAGILKKTGLHADNLRLEVTESSLMSDADGALTMMHALRELGVGLHMDDFGTGYSSLHYLHRFPFDTLKIDPSFIQQVCDNRESLQIVRTILELAQSLGMDVVAEGIETQPQLASLKTLGCRYGQGYYFARPMEASAVTSLLMQSQAANPPDGHMQFRSRVPAPMVQ